MTLTTHSRLTVGHHHRGPLPLLRDLDQPYPFTITLPSKQRLRLAFYDTASPTNYTLLTPSIVILCYSIASPQSLTNLQTHWKILLETHFGHHAALPVIVLGLQRDARREEDYTGAVQRLAPSPDEQDLDDDKAVLNGRTIVYPQEALRIAAEMRCDRYCECSARTGDLCLQVIEDIAATARATLTKEGGLSKNPLCAVM
jgi:GTPase SAR1 family protein